MDLDLNRLSAHQSKQEVSAEGKQKGFLCFWIHFSLWHLTSPVSCVLPTLLHNNRFIWHQGVLNLYWPILSILRSLEHLLMIDYKPLVPTLTNTLNACLICSLTSEAVSFIGSHFTWAPVYVRYIKCAYANTHTHTHTRTHTHTHTHCSILRASPSAVFWLRSGQQDFIMTAAVKTDFLTSADQSVFLMTARGHTQFVFSLPT